MKKYLSIVILGVFVYLGCCAKAVTIGVGEPPAKYIEKLKTCTPSTFNAIFNGYNNNFQIKGRLNDGRCHVVITGSYDYSDPQTYKDAVGVIKLFGASEAEARKIVDEEVKNPKKDVTVCKFTNDQIKAVSAAYAKHDGKTPKGDGVTRDKNGDLIGIKSSFSTSNMSSYDTLMMNYSAGTCVQND